MVATCLVPDPGLCVDVHFDIDLIDHYKTTRQMQYYMNFHSYVHNRPCQHDYGHSHQYMLHRYLGSR